MDISTHTLTWSVTSETRILEKSETISTHTLTWSVTRLCMVHRPQTCHFNSHAHVERDMELARSQRTNGHFNSHAHVERDLWNILTAEVKLEISTHTLTWSVTINLSSGIF